MHTTALAGAASALFLLAIKTPCANYIPFVLAIVALAKVIWARLYLKEHTIAEIVSGVAIGVVSQSIAWYFYA
jgi:membrane-associated phospholipid phosphatase